MLITKEFQFHAAHYLTKYHGACERLHGHTYTLQITVEGEVQENGLVIDFSILKKIVEERILSKCDHGCINDFLPNPSAELMVKWMWDELENMEELLKNEIDNPNLSEEIKNYLRKPENATKEVPSGLKLFEIKLWETPTSHVTYRGK